MSHTCLICHQEYNQNYVAFENDYWLIRHSEETDIAAYFILQSKRHMLDLSDANENEVNSYGSILKSLMKVIRSITNCKRIYTFSLAEAVPHYHLHVIPRSEDFPSSFIGRAITSYPLAPACDSKTVVELCSKTKNMIAQIEGCRP